MEEAMRELFNKTTQMFVERSAIHDLCSKQIGEYIARKGWIRPTDSIMDFGCGIGSFSFTLYLQAPFASCLGVDSSDKMIQSFDHFSQEKGLSDVFQSECVFLDKPNMLHDRQFDVIISLKAFHHIPDPLPCIRVLVFVIPRVSLLEVLLEAKWSSYHRRPNVG
ncbi:hypothetical protein WA538_005523 [Blastocystis sp. DL]